VPVHESSAIPFWTLLLLFEALICQPQASRSDLNKQVLRRLQLFTAGHIQELHDEMMARPRTKPSTHARQADIDEWSDSISFRLLDPDRTPRFNSGAQKAADRDQLHSAFQRLDDSLPIALNTDATVQAVRKKLYPPPCASNPYPAAPSRTHASWPRTRLLPEDTDMLDAIRRIHTGTSSGPFADSTDLLRAFALTSQQMGTHDKEVIYPNLGLFRDFIDLLQAGDVPEDTIPAFTSNYFLALHKSVDDDEKLRPIGIGTHPRRVLGTIMSFAYAGDFATQLWPFQFGIALSSGMHFLVHAFQSLMYKYLPGSPIESTNSRAFFQFDMTNMFNEASRTTCRHELEEDTIADRTVPVFDLLYHTPNICWYLRPDGSWGSFPQREGFSQGCPLSPYFACKVLHPVMKELNKRLDARAALRLANGDPGDDGFGSRSANGAYLDDAGTLCPYVDCDFAITTFKELGLPHGLRLNFDKTKALITLDPEILPDNDSLTTALQRLKPTKRLTRGTVYLGAPMGSNDFVAEELEAACDTFDSSRLHIQQQLSDLQTQMSLYCQCLQATIPHLLAADVLLRGPSSPQPVNPFKWCSPFVSRLSASTANFLAFESGHSASLFGHDSVSWFLAHVLVAGGGLGLMDYSARAVASFVVPLATSLHHATIGFSARRTDTVLPVPDALACGLTDWKTSNVPSLVLFRSLTPSLLAHEKFRNVTDVVSHLVDAMGKRTTIRDLVRSHKRRELQTFYDTAPPELASLLPSILQRHTSEALLHMSRRSPDHRLASPYFKLLLCRKLRLPIYDDNVVPPICRCKTRIDVFGDHFFGCKFHSKTPIHNRIRDCLHLLCSEIGPHAGLTSSRSDVVTEPVNMVSGHPTSRPADVSITLLPTYAVPPLIPFAKAAIDVTITGSLQPAVTGGDSHSYTGSVTRHHQTAESKKFRGRDILTARTCVMGENIIRALNETNVVFIPFTVDPFGGIGPVAQKFLYGTRPDPAPDPLDFPTSATAALAYKNAMSKSAPTAILSLADKSWKDKGAHLSFSSTYHAWFPSTWGRQILGANINLSFAMHLHAGMHASYEQRRNKRGSSHDLAVGRHSRFVPFSKRQRLPDTRSARTGPLHIHFR